MNRKELEKEFQKLANKARMRRKAFIDKGLSTSQLKQLEVQLKKQANVKAYSRGVKKLSERQLKESIGIYSANLNRSTTKVSGYISAEKKRMKSWGIEGVKAGRAMEEIGKVMNKYKSKLQSYGYDSKMMKSALQESFKEKGTIKSVSVRRIGSLVTNYIKDVGENLVKEDVDELIKQGYILEERMVDGKVKQYKVTWDSHGRHEVEYRDDSLQ